MGKLRQILLFFAFSSYMVASNAFSVNLSTKKGNEDTTIKNFTAQECATIEKKSENGYWSFSDTNVEDIDKRRKLIAFTFDDAPAKSLEKIVALFLGYNRVHPDAPAFATIFCNGCRITKPSDPTLYAAVAAGFELGNHTQNHKKLTTLSATELKQEIDETNKQLFLYDGKKSHLFRAPYGELNERVCSFAGAPVIDWFIDTLDWTGISAEEIYDTVWDNKCSGAIVLMHDGYDNTLQALKRLLPDLYDAGYQAVTVSQMAKAHQCPLKIGGVYTRARKKTSI